MKKFLLTSVFLFIAISPLKIFAQLADSPWPMFRGNPLHTGVSAYTGSGVNTLKWKYKTNDDGHNINSSPVIGADGTIYIGCEDKTLYAVTRDGVKKWKFKTGGMVISTPAIAADGTIYVGTNDDKVFAINPDGTEKWKYKTNSQVQSSPVIGPDATIYVGSNNGDLHAINPDGTMKWKFDTGDGTGFSSPALGPDGTIYIGSTDGKLTAITSSGVKLWKYDTDSGINSSPALAPDGTIYIGSNDGNLTAITSSGTKLWKYDANANITSSAAIGKDGTIYVGRANDRFLAINPDGTKKWDFKKDNGFDSSPVIGADGVIYVGCNNGKLYAINPDGTELWKYDANGKVFSSPAIGPDGTVYVGAKQHLFAIGTSSAPEQKTLSIPAVSGSPGETVEVTININNASGIKSGDITIAFDNAILTAGEAEKTALSSELSLTSQITGGQITLSFSSSAPLSGGSGALFTIPFTVSNSAPEGTTTMTFTNTQFKDKDGNKLEVTTVNGSFTVQIEGEIVVSIPDVSGLAGETVNATVVINDATGVLSGDFTIAYDSSKMTAGNAIATDLTSNFSIVSLVNQGEIKISIASSSPIASGNGALVSIPFTIYPEAQGSSPLSLANATVYNADYQPVTITTQDGTLNILPVCTKGDVNNDGSITSVDASMVLQISVGLIEPDTYQMCAGDVNNDGKINSLDASLILQCSVGNCNFPTESGKILMPSSSENVVVTVSIPDVKGKGGSAITVPVNVDTAAGILAGDLTVQFDPAVLTASSVNTTPLTSHFAVSTNISQGKIRISLASSSAISSGSGSLVEIHFLTLKNVKKYTPIELSEVALYNQNYQAVTVNAEDGSFTKKKK